MVSGNFFEAPTCVGHCGSRYSVDRSRAPTHRGVDRDRTDDLRLAKPALSQLSYDPWVLV